MSLSTSPFRFVQESRLQDWLCLAAATQQSGSALSALWLTALQADCISVSFRAGEPAAGSVVLSSHRAGEGAGGSKVAAGSTCAPGAGACRPRRAKEGEIFQSSCVHHCVLRSSSGYPKFARRKACRGCGSTIWLWGCVVSADGLPPLNAVALRRGITALTRRAL